MNPLDWFIIYSYNDKQNPVHRHTHYNKGYYYIMRKYHRYGFNGSRKTVYGDDYISSETTLTHEARNRRMTSNTKQRTCSQWVQDADLWKSRETKARIVCRQFEIFWRF